MTEKSNKYLLALSRQTIVDYFTLGKKLVIDEKTLPTEEVAKKAASFVTLTQNGQLRGCVGTLLAKRKMYEDVINNSLMAAFGDTRFEQLKEMELPDTKIEISILSEATPYNQTSSENLLEMMEPGKHGVIIQNEFAQATFLPQVWGDLPDKKEFMEALSQKAGLPKDAWTYRNAEVFWYTVSKFSD